MRNIFGAGSARTGCGRTVIRGALAVLALCAAPSARANVIVNNPALDLTAQNTQSGAGLVVFGSTVLATFNDSGSFSPGNNAFTGIARSTDGGATFTDLGRLPTSAVGDAGYPTFARNNTSGVVYLGALSLNTGGVQLYHSTDGGLTYGAPVNATPGRTVPNAVSVAVDNNPGTGNGTVYVATRSFDAGNGVFIFKSTDNGATFGPGGGLLLASGGDGVRVVVAPDHSVSAVWFEGTGANERIVTRRSTDGGLTYGAPVTVANLDTTGILGNLGLTGIRSNTIAPAPFRTNAFPQMVVNPASGHLYTVFADDGLGADRGNIYLSYSTDNGATWSPRIRVNSDATVNDQWQPTIAMTPDGAHFGVFWYDRRLDAANNLIDYFGRICDIVGLSFNCGSDFRVSDVSFLPEFGGDPVVNPQFMGDFDLAAADDDFFYVAWGDNRLASPVGDRQDANVFFDRIAVGPAAPPGSVPEPGTFALLLAALFAVRFFAVRP